MKLGNLNLINAVVFFVIIWATQSLVSVEKSGTFELLRQNMRDLQQVIADAFGQNPDMMNFSLFGQDQQKEAQIFSANRNSLGAEEDVDDTLLYATITDSTRALDRLV